MRGKMSQVLLCTLLVSLLPLAVNAAPAVQSNFLEKSHVVQGLVDASTFIPHAVTDWTPTAPLSNPDPFSFPLAPRVTNLDTGEWFDTIQEAISDTDTLDGHTILATSGTYTENIAIDKQITLTGQGLTQTVIYPAVSDVGLPDPDAPPSFRGSQVIVVEAHNVTIRDLAVNGDNPNLTSGYVIHGADVDARNGIIANMTLDSWDDLHVYDVLVENCFLRGIYASSRSSEPGASTGIEFVGDTVHNVDGNADNSAALMFWGSYGVISDCLAADAAVGIMFHWYSGGVIANNEAYGSRNSAIATNSNSEPPGQATLVYGNYVHDNAGLGMQALWNAHDPVHLYDNVVLSSTWGLGIYGDDANGPYDHQIYHNTIQGNGGNEGVWVENYSMPGVSLNLHHNAISNFDSGVLFYWDAADPVPGFVANRVENNVICKVDQAVLVYTGTHAAVVSGTVVHANALEGGIYSVYNGTSTLLDASANWLGDNTPAAVAASVSPNVDYTPWLHDGTDQSGDPGFQPDWSYLHVDDDSPQAIPGGRIREGIAWLSGSTVRVEAGLYGESLHITKSLWLEGAGAPSTTVDAGGAGRVVHVAAGSAVTITGLTLQQGYVEGDGAGILNEGSLWVMHTTVSGNVVSGSTSMGGGIYNAGLLTLTASAVVSNTAGGDGGGVASVGALSGLTLINTTLSGNGAAGDGAGLFVDAGGGAALNAVTIADNSAGGSGGGLQVTAGAAVAARNSLLADNTAANGPDCADAGGGFASQGYNLLEDGAGGCATVGTDLLGLDPLLGPLAGNGGDTPTQVLLPGSPAIAAIPDGGGGFNGAPDVDQRGVARPWPAAGDCDIGAYEYDGVAPAVLGDWVWKDLDFDGIQDPAEPGLAAVTVILYTCAGIPLDTTSTDAAGVYTFTGVVSDGYYVQFDLPTGGYTFTLQDQGSDDTRDSDADPSSGQTACTFLDPGERDPRWDAGMYQLFSLGDYVWYDTNRDGLQDWGLEPPVEGIAVDLYDDGDCSGTPIASDTTDAAGHYGFDSLAAGTYCLQFYDIPAFWVISPPDQGNDGMDSDADPLTGQINDIVITSTDDLDEDVGLYAQGAAGDTVWCDADDNGSCDPGEGVVSVTVSLYDDMDCDGVPEGLLATQDTVTDGQYLFDDLQVGPAGIYSVCYVLAVDAADMGDCSHPITPLTYTVALDAATPRDLDNDFGFNRLPHLVLDAPPLQAALCPEATALITLTLCNTGTGLLEWRLSEVVELSWLSQDPVSGTLAADGCTGIDVLYDAAGMGPGDYVGDLLLESNDPDLPSLTLPVTLTVFRAAGVVTVTTNISGCQVTFGAELTGTAPLEWLWDMGAWGVYTEASPLVDFGTDGTYPYTLTAWNACGQDVLTGTVTVACLVPCEPVVILSHTEEVSGCQVSFSAEVSGDAPFEWLWSFGDGMTSTAEMPAHLYGSTGVYTVTLEVWNCGDGYDVTVFPVEVTCEPIYRIYLPLVLNQYDF